MGKPEGVTEAVADFVVRSSLASVPDAVRTKAAKHVADTVAVMLAGTRGDLAGPLRDYVARSGAAGGSRIVGWGDRVTAEMAAFANGTLGHALDYDDANTAMRGHPSAIAVGALLAAPEVAGSSGADFLEAYITGVEVATKISKGMDMGPHNNPGWHITGTMGVFASAGALAKLNGLDRGQIRRALGIVGSMASGLQRNFGTMTKPLHSGWAARSGTAAVDLALSGWTANEEILDGPVSFSAAYAGGTSHPETIGESLGNPYVFAEPQFGMNLKLYPCCYGVHRSIEAIRSLTGGKPADPSTIRSVQCRVLPDGLRPLLYKRPKTGLEGKFSMEYAIAATIIDGTVGFSSFTDDAVSRPAVRELMERLDVAEDPRCGVGEDGVTLPNTYGIGTRGYVEITIEKTDGTREVKRVYAPLGSAARELSWDDLEAKFNDCAAEAGVDPHTAHKAFNALADIESLADITETIATLQVTNTTS